MEYIRNMFDIFDRISDKGNLFMKILAIIMNLNDMTSIRFFIINVLFTRIEQNCENCELIRQHQLGLNLKNRKD